VFRDGITKNNRRKHQQQRYPWYVEELLFPKIFAKLSSTRLDVPCCRSLFNLGDEDEDETQEEDKAKDNGTISPAIYGSRAITFGGGNELIADQFNLYTVQQKHNQIVLIQVFCCILLRCLC
jgi:hypothetical protein